MKDQKHIYLNTAGTGLISHSAIEAAQKFQNATLTDPSKAFLEWRQNDLPVLRKTAAELVHATEDQVAFTPNFSFALLPIVQSLQSRVRKVLLYQEDYPSLNLPFELGSFEMHYVKSTDYFHISLEAIKSIIEKEKIEVVAFSHVQFLSGFKTDITALGKYCKEKGVVFIVDATQSVGATPIDFNELPVDVLMSSSYKWLNGGFGSSLLYVKESFLAAFPPRVAGYGSLIMENDDWEYKPSNKSFEPGHLNAPALLQLQDGIRQKLQRGLTSIEAHNINLVQRLQNGLLELPYEIIGGDDIQNRLNILCFRAEKDTADYLNEKGFVFTFRKNSIRISPHFYNTEADIDALLTALSQFQK